MHDDRSEVEDNIPWEGDYKNLKEEDFLPSPPPDDPPILSKVDKQGFSVSVFWSLTIACITLYNWRFNNPGEWSANYSSIIEREEYWRLWSSLFIHSDFGHLMSNIWLFAVFAYLLRSFWGAIVFPGISILLIGGLTSLTTIFWYGPGTGVLGASGLIYGMIGLWLVTYCSYDTRFSLPKRVFRAFGFVLIMLFPQTYAIHVSYSAHFFGFLYGIALGIWMVSQRKPEINVPSIH